MTSMEISPLSTGETIRFADEREHGSLGERILRKIKSAILNNLLLLFTLLGVGLGFVVGFAVREIHPSESALMWLGKY